MTSLVLPLWLPCVCSLFVRFALLLLWCHSPCQLTLLSLTFRRSTVLRTQAFQQDNGETKAAIARFVAPAAGDRWRAPNLGDGLFGHRAPVWTLWSSSPAPRQGNWISPDSYHQTDHKPHHWSTVVFIIGDMCIIVSWRQKAQKV